MSGSDVLPLLLDEMFAPTIADQLKRRGHDVDCVARRPELLSVPDEELLATATREGRVLVTRNVGDFVQLDHRWKLDGRQHAGIVYVTTSAFPQDASFPGAVVTALHKAPRAGMLPAEDDVLYLHQK